MASESASLPTGEIRVEKPVDLNVHRKLLAILNSVQAIISEGNDIKMLRQVLEKLQEILMLLPEKENLFEGLDGEGAFDVKMRRISRRLYMLSEELQKGLPFPENNELNSSIDKTELELRLHEAFAAGTKRKPLDPEKKRLRDEQRALEIENWINNLRKKSRLYRFRLSTSFVVQEALDVLQEISDTDFKEVRIKIRDKLSELLAKKSVPSFLQHAYEITSGSCLEAFPRLAPQIKQLHQDLPAPDQLARCNFTKGQIKEIKEKVETCIHELEKDPDKKVEELLKKVRQAKGSGKRECKEIIRSMSARENHSS